MPRSRCAPALAALLAAPFVLAACADKADTIAPSYVSPMMYQSMNCRDLGEEAQQVSSRAAQAVATQDRKADNDAAATAISLVLFWPAAFFIRGDGQSAADVARLKGEMQAIEAANNAKRCGIRFAS